MSAGVMWCECSYEVREGWIVCVCVQRSVIDAIMDVTEERPWLWVIIAIVVIAPLFMCVIYCCVPPSQVLALTMTALSAHCTVH